MIYQLYPESCDMEPLQERREMSKDLSENLSVKMVTVAKPGGWTVPLEFGMATATDDSVSLGEQSALIHNAKLWFTVCCTDLNSSSQGDIPC
jgi:hypothetical protein